MIITYTKPLPLVGFSRLMHAHTLCLMGEGEWREARVLVATIDTPITGELLDQMPNLELVANYGVGYNQINLEACRTRGLRVTNTPKPVVEPTAELAFALMVDVVRRVSDLDRRLRQHRAEPFGIMTNLSHTLWGKTLGIIGMGNIGRAMARRAVASGMKIVYHNRHRYEQDEAIPARYVEMEELLRTADVVSLNLPYTPATHHLIGAEQFKMMKPTAYLVNTARGPHVDEAALMEALREGQIAGAALDVYDHEPVIAPQLLAMDNVVLTPHVGTSTREDRVAMVENVTDNILAWINNELDKMDIVL